MLRMVLLLLFADLKQRFYRALESAVKRVDRVA